MSTRVGGRYDLIREIGSGGMGRVFEARDSESDRTVAVKVMHAGADLDLHALLRFQQEGAVLAALKHPNIVAVYASFLEEDSCSLVMELIEGRPLGQIMHSGALTLPRIKVIAEQVLSALAYAHSRGIVHRDIKPDNIMVGPGDRVKVTDFGIARILAPGSTLNTRTGTAIGTPLYMSPEQIEGQRVDGRSDLYSLGTVMYQMLVGRPPFEGDDPLTIAFQHVHKAPPPPSEFSSDVPEDWERVILQALAKGPADRFQSADAMGSAVSRLSTLRVERPKLAGKPDTVQKIISPELTEESPAVETLVVSSTRRAEPQPSAAGARSVTVPLPNPRWIIGAGLVVVALVVALVLLNQGGSGATATSPSLPTHFVTSWGGQGGGPDQMTAPAAVAVDSANHIYVADYDNNRISVFSDTGRPLHQWVLRDPKTGTFYSASGVAVSGSTVYAVEPNGGQILKLKSGKIVAAWKGAGLRSPSNVATAKDGSIYVVDNGNNRIQKLSPDGKVLHVFGSKGSAPGKLNYPSAIAVEPNGSVLVTDTGNYRIERFSQDGKFLDSGGGEGRGKGQFESVAGVVVAPDGTVYASDSKLARIQAFSPSGKVLAVWGEKGNGPRGMQSPVGLALDDHGNLYVVDSTRDIVLKYAPKG